MAKPYLAGDSLASASLDCYGVRETVLKVVVTPGGQ